MTFCNTNESAVAPGGRLRGWATDRLTWAIASTPSPFSESEARDVYADAWKQWTDNSGLQMEYNGNIRTANVVMDTRAIDGTFGVLAEAQLPNAGMRSNGQLRMWFDTGERWVSALNTPPRAVDLFRVAVHEQGHTLGLDHDTDGQTNAIMDPSISDIRELQESDIRRIQQRHGEPNRVDPVPPNNPQPNDCCNQLLTGGNMNGLCQLLPLLTLCGGLGQTQAATGPTDICRNIREAGDAFQQVLECLKRLNPDEQSAMANLAAMTVYGRDSAKEDDRQKMKQSILSLVQ